MGSRLLCGWVRDACPCLTPPPAPLPPLCPACSRLQRRALHAAHPGQHRQRHHVRGHPRAHHRRAAEPLVRGRGGWGWGRGGGEQEFLLLGAWCWHGCAAAGTWEGMQGACTVSVGPPRRRRTPPRESRRCAAPARWTPPVNAQEGLEGAGSQPRRRTLFNFSACLQVWACRRPPRCGHRHARGHPAGVEHAQVRTHLIGSACVYRGGAIQM